MSTSTAWLLLRIPRMKSATTMSGVLGIGDDYVTTAVGADIPAVCDALLASAREAGHTASAVTLVYPLDGRHQLAHLALEEAQRRGWRFERHLPRGAEPHLLDLEGADAAPTWEAGEVATLFDALIKEIQQAVQASELGEALAILRRLLALGLRHFGAWHPDTFWAASNLMRFAGGTGADANIEQAEGLIEHLLRQPFPAQFDNTFGLLRKLEETAKNAAQCGRTDLAVRLAEAAVAVAQQAFGTGHSNHLATQNNLCLLLSALKSPKAEPAMRALLQTARESMGAQHPNIAVVLMNLAELLENQGRADEAAPLREEAQHIRSAAG